MSKALKDMYSRKSGNAGEVEEAVGTLVHQKLGLQHLCTEHGFLTVEVFSVSVAVPVLRSLTQHCLGSDPNHGVVPLLPHLQHSYLHIVLLLLRL